MRNGLVEFSLQGMQGENKEYALSPNQSACSEYRKQYVCEWGYEVMKMTRRAGVGNGFALACLEENKRAIENVVFSIFKGFY